MREANNPAKSADKVIHEAREFISTYHDRNKAFELLHGYSEEFGDDYRIWLEMARALYPFDEALGRIYEYYTAAERLAPDNEKKMIRTELDRLLSDFDEGKKRRIHDLTVQTEFSEKKIKECDEALDRLKEQIAAAESEVNKNRRQSMIYSEKAEEFRRRAARLSIKPPSLFLVFAVPVIIAAAVFGVLIIFRAESDVRQFAHIAAAFSFCAAGIVIVVGIVRAAMSAKMRSQERKQLALLRQSNESVARFEALTAKLKRQLDYTAEACVSCKTDVQKMRGELSSIKTSREILNK